MDIIQCLIASDGVHVGVQPVPHAEIIAFERQALPLCKRMYHLRLGVECGHIKGNGALHTVKVVIQSGCAGDEQRCRDPLKVQRGGKFALKGTLDMLNGTLGIVFIQHRAVSGRDRDAVHGQPPCRRCIIESPKL